MLIGYARVSTGDQDLALQLDALKAAGCARWFSDTASGSLTERPQLKRAMEELRDGEDTLVVWRLDRLGRSLRHLIELIGELERRQIGFRSLTEGIDTTTSSGRLVFHIFGAIAEFERQLIRERTQAGLKAARARGRLGGRRTVITDEKLRVARDMLAGGQHTMQQIADTIGVGRATLYRHLDHSLSRKTPPLATPLAAAALADRSNRPASQSQRTRRAAGAQAGSSLRPTGSTKEDGQVHRAPSTPVGRSCRRPQAVAAGDLSHLSGVAWGALSRPSRAAQDPPADDRAALRARLATAPLPHLPRPARRRLLYAPRPQHRTPAQRAPAPERRRADPHRAWEELQRRAQTSPPCRSPASAAPAPALDRSGLSVSKTISSRKLRRGLISARAIR